MTDALSYTSRVLTKAALANSGKVLGPSASSTTAGKGKKELSGAVWVSRFPGSKKISDLESGFGKKVREFVDAMEAAGASISINSTLRPPERAYLMHWSWEIVTQGFDPKKVPPMVGVNINWDHGNKSDSVAAARDMVNGYGMSRLKVAPALTSRHTQGKAIDMNISWSGDLKIKKADGTVQTISSDPQNGTNPDLIAVGKTYGVIHFLNVAHDRPHWSTDGH